MESVSIQLRPRMLRITPTPCVAAWRYSSRTLYSDVEAAIFIENMIAAAATTGFLFRANLQSG